MKYLMGRYMVMLREPVAAFGSIGRRGTTEAIRIRRRSSGNEFESWRMLEFASDIGVF